MLMGMFEETRRVVLESSNPLGEVKLCQYKGVFLASLAPQMKKRIGIFQNALILFYGWLPLATCGAEWERNDLPHRWEEPVFLPR